MLCQALCYRLHKQLPGSAGTLCSSSAGTTRATVQPETSAAWVPPGHREQGSCDRSPVSLQGVHIPTRRGQGAGLSHSDSPGGASSRVSKWVPAWTAACHGHQFGQNACDISRYWDLAGPSRTCQFREVLCQAGACALGGSSDRLPPLSQVSQGEVHVPCLPHSSTRPTTLTS